MNQNADKILLIYPFGNSDLAFNGEETFPRECYRDFRAHLETLGQLLAREDVPSLKPLQLEQESFPSGLDFSALPLERRKTQRNGKEFIIETVRFPILFDVLQGLKERVNPEDERELLIQPIVTDQPTYHPQDTIGIPPLVEVYMAFVVNACNRLPFHIRCQRPWTIQVTASDYDALLAPYRDFYEQAQATFSEFDHVYFSLTTGTPAMSFAAGLIFASDPRVTFIYKPRGASTLTHVSTFQERVRQETLHRLQHLLERFEFMGALDVLKAPRNGFAPHEVQDAQQLLHALVAWQNYDFQGAAQALSGLTQNGKRYAFKALCECLAQEQPSERAKFWRTKITDTVMRLEIAIYRRDLPAVLYHFYNYNDVCLAWGLNAYFPQLDVMDPDLETMDPSTKLQIEGLWDAFARRCPQVKRQVKRELKSELGKFQPLFIISAETEQSAPMSELRSWFSVHERLRFFQDSYVDSKRHQLVHGSVQLQEQLFDQIFQESLQQCGKGLTLPTGTGPRLLLGLTYQSFNALPPRNGLPSDLARSLAQQAWQDVARLVSAAPSAPSWVDWASYMQPVGSVLQNFLECLSEAFKIKIRKKQQELEGLIDRWKQEINSEIVASDLPIKDQLRTSMLRNLQGYQPPSWGHYMVQHLIDENPDKHRQTVKMELIASLHPSLNRSNWEKKPEINVGSLIGNYLKGNFGFQELLKKVGILSAPPKKPAKPSQRPQGIKIKHKIKWKKS